MGGSSHLSSLLAQGFASDDHSVIVITASYEDAPECEMQGEVKIRRFKAWKLPRLGRLLAFDIRFCTTPANIRRIFRALDDFKPEVLHIHGQFMDLAWIVSVYARRRNIPTLLSIHTRLESPSKSIQFVFGLLDRLFVGPLIRMSTPSVVAMDKLMRDYISEKYCIPNHRIVAIPVGVATDGTSSVASASEVRSKYGLGDGPIVLSVGHVIPVRDRVALIKALPRMLCEYGDLKVVVVGDVEYPKFLDVAKELGVENHLICLGRLQKEDVKNLFQIAAVEAHDLQGLGMGTANLEAMQAGCPVVVAIEPDNFLDFNLRNGIDALLVAPNDSDAIAQAIIDLLGNVERAATVGANGRNLVARHFSIDAVSAKHIEVLDRLVHGVSR